LIAISAIPNSPIATGTKPMPSASSWMPSVIRICPVLRSVPTLPSSSPTRTIVTALSTEPRASTTEPTSPRVISAKYSGARKRCAAAASGSETTAISSVETQPAKNEPIAATASAGPARPCRAIAWPSRQVTTAEDSPGRLTRIAVVEPPYCAP
jgi:hypothetical protein